MRFLRGVLGALALCAFAHASQYDEPRLTALAKSAVVAEVEGKTPTASSKKDPVQPVFVTIEVGGQIRGCRGSLVTRSRTLDEEIVLAARGAAAHDPRYKPLTKDELKTFKVTVTIVESQIPISDVTTLTAADGLALQSGSKWGIVLPWEGKDPQVRLDWAYKKAGVAKGSSANLFRLIATRFRG